MDEEIIKYFKAWAGFGLLCVDDKDPNFDHMELLGDPGSMISEKIIIQARKCHQDSREAD